MINDMAISTITICGLLTGILSSSVLITNEFKRQIVLAVLCKPITRIQFILGKYLGIIAAVMVLVFSQGLVLEIFFELNKFLNFSNIESYAATLNDKSPVDFYCLLGIYFSLLQVLILTSISVILSIYLNVTANVIICFLVFVFSHIISYVFPFYDRAESAVSLIYVICYVVFPSLHNLNIFEMYNVTDGFIYMYILYASLYSLLYCTMIIWLAVFCFKRKECF